VQKHDDGIILNLPEQNFNLLNLLLTSRIVEKVPADLLIFPFLEGCREMVFTKVPAGILTS